MTFSGSFSSAGVEEALGQLAQSLRDSPERVVDAARDIAKAIEGFLQASIAAGTDAYGEPWKLTLEGEQPLRGAMSEITVQATGTTIIVTLGGVEVMHHIGFAKGYGGGTKLRRPIIPENRASSAKHKGGREKGVPKEWEEAIRGIVASHIGIG